MTDESSRQTEIIIEAIKNKAIGNDIEEIIKKGILFKHNTAQRMLKKYEIQIPYAQFLNLPYNVVSTRRAFDQLLSMIKAVSFLRQYQKEINNEIIKADITEASEKPSF